MELAREPVTGDVETVGGQQRQHEGEVVLFFPDPALDHDDQGRTVELRDGQPCQEQPGERQSSCQGSALKFHSHRQAMAGNR